MLVVADSSPLHYLILIGSVDVLPALFGDVLIPGTVRDELSHPSAPSEVRQYLAAPPPWLRVRDPARLEVIPQIDPGEIAAISLARELGADLLLVDDLDGREAARERGIGIVGTLGVLESAAARGLIDLSSAFDRIRQTRFRISDALLDAALARDRARRGVS